MIIIYKTNFSNQSLNIRSNAIVNDSKLIHIATFYIYISQSTEIQWALNHGTIMKYHIFTWNWVIAHDYFTYFNYTPFRMRKSSHKKAAMAEKLSELLCNHDSWFNYLILFTVRRLLTSLLRFTLRDWKFTLSFGRSVVFFCVSFSVWIRGKESDCEEKKRKEKRVSELICVFHVLCVYVACVCAVISKSNKRRVARSL